MKYHCLVLWTLAAYVSCETPAVANKIKVVELADGIKLTCEGNLNVTGNYYDQKEVILLYEDKNTAEYRCHGSESAIYVKFRTCDNCVELDVVSIVGMAIGNLVASVVIGVAVYMIANPQSRTAQPAPTKKRSDRQNLLPNEAGSSSSSDHYQRLRHKQPKDEYDVLRK